MSILERCLYCRGVCITEVSVLQRCQYYRGVCINTEVSILESVCIRGVFIRVVFVGMSIGRRFTVLFLLTLQLKCHQYWPKDEGHSMLFGSLRVTMKRQTSLAFWKERLIHITHNEVGNRLLSIGRGRGNLPGPAVNAIHRLAMFQPCDGSCETNIQPI